MRDQRRGKTHRVDVEQLINACENILLAVIATSGSRHVTFPRLPESHGIETAPNPGRLSSPNAASMGATPPTDIRILEAAISAIESGGETGLRVDVIAAEAGITKPSIYYFFGSRDGLVAAAQAERYRRSMLTGLVEAIELTRAASSRDEFEALLPAYVDVVMGPDGARRRAQRVQVLGSADPAFDRDAIALWWLSNTLGRHLVDLVADERLHEQWRAITLAQLRQLYFGEA